MNTSFEFDKYVNKTDILKTQAEAVRWDCFNIKEVSDFVGYDITPQLKKEFVEILDKLTSSDFSISGKDYSKLQNELELVSEFQITLDGFRKMSVKYSDWILKDFEGKIIAVDTDEFFNKNYIIYKKKNRESNLVKHAERELTISGFNDEDFFRGDVLELIKVFSEQGHSGMSAYPAINLFTKLAKYECLSPITGSDAEFKNVSEIFSDDTNTTYQNIRCGKIFKKGDIYTYLDGVVFRDINNEDNLFTGSGVEGLSSEQIIKSFPFEPKTFFVNVYKDYTGESDDEYEWRLCNITETEAVFEYYQRP